MRRAVPIDPVGQTVAEVMERVLDLGTLQRLVGGPVEAVAHRRDVRRSGTSWSANSVTRGSTV